MIGTEPIHVNSSQIAKFPPTRYMGSKTKLLSNIWDATQGLEFTSVVDPFAGSGVVSYMFKAQGKRVISNDYMKMNSLASEVLIANNTETLLEADILELANIAPVSNGFISNKFSGLYFDDDDNEFLDAVRQEIENIDNDDQRALAVTALVRACIKKRPRGIFTYVGHRYDDGRRDIKMDLRAHFIEQAHILNKAVFDNGLENESQNVDAMELEVVDDALIYFDPPYYSPLSDNAYVRRYHFVEGLARNWEGITIQEHTLTKKFKNYPTPFSTKKGTVAAFDRLFEKYSSNKIVLSYSSNSLPGMDELVLLLRKYKDNVEVQKVEHTYSFGTQKANSTGQRNKVDEFIFLAT